MKFYAIAHARLLLAAHRRYIHARWFIRAWICLISNHEARGDGVCTVTARWAVPREVWTSVVRADRRLACSRPFLGYPALSKYLFHVASCSSRLSQLTCPRIYRESPLLISPPRPCNRDSRDIIIITMRGTGMRVCTWKIRQPDAPPAILGRSPNANSLNRQNE